MGKCYNLHLVIIPYSGLFSLEKYFRHFHHYSPVTKLNSTKSSFVVVVSVALITITKINSTKSSFFVVVNMALITVTKIILMNVLSYVLASSYDKKNIYRQ